MQDQDTEVTLGTGRLLALFFGLVVICALFFSAGFSLGRKSAPVQLANVLQPSTTSPDTPADKPVAAKPAAPAQAAPSTSDEMTFYKSVQQNDAKPQLDQPATSAPASVAPAASTTAQAAPEMAPAPVLGSGYMVQIAAVTRQEDADALVNALRKKQYPVFSSTLPTDKLFHVQVGPFADIKQADDMKAKLVSDGYNPIVKK